VRLGLGLFPFSEACPCAFFTLRLKEPSLFQARTIRTSDRECRYPLSYPLM